jgi:SAM-dependent methyltransferase
MSDDGVGLGTPPVREGRSGPTWFREHFEDAPNAIIDFLAGDGITLEGKDVADIGSGDGIIDLALALKARPARLVGYDIVATDPNALRGYARGEGAVDELPSNLSFAASETKRIPAESASFDVAVTWSTFEHVDDPIAMLREVRRILKPHGLLFLQVWPLWHSQHGSHLWQYFPEGFVQLLRPPDEIAAAVRAEPGPDVEWSEILIEQFHSCNRLTLDELQRCLFTAGFRVGKLELMAGTIHIPPGLEQLPLSLLGISGVKLLAGASA